MASSSQGGGRGAPVLKSAAEVVARSAASGQPLEITAQLKQLKEVLLAEHADASHAAKERCQRLRTGFYAALKAALALHGGSQLLQGIPPPKVRVEVRHTAGRAMLGEVFTVGRAAECDVQTTGDPTSSRLQLLVISLPQGLCITDAWSSSGTRVVRREASGEALFASVPQHRAAFILPHGERVTLMTGAKTSVTFGPAVSELKVPVDGPARMPTALVEVPMPKAVPAPSSPVCSRAISCQRSTMRAQQQTLLRERLRGRFWAARRLGLLAKQQQIIFQERLASGETEREDLKDFLDGLGVIPAPDEPCTLSWTCGACNAQQRLRGFRCPLKHRSCRECFLQANGKCPVEGCSYLLGLSDMQDLRFPEAQWKAETPVPGKEPLLHCAHGCGAALAASPRQRWACSCGAQPVCTGCGTTYHYHGKCDEVRRLRARWSAWLAGGREAYKQLQKRLTRSANTQTRALQEALEIGSQAASQDVAEAKAKAKAKAKPQVARYSVLAGHGVRHLSSCALCGKGIVGPRFRCIHCPNYNACPKCEGKLTEHPEGHVFQIMFEDELDWEKADVELPKKLRARLRLHAMEEVPSEGRKRSLNAEGVLRSFKRGRYQLELTDGSGLVDVSPKDIQPLLTQAQADRLTSLGIFEAPA